MKKRALVAGGGRFPGFQLCKQLLDKGYQVVCLDDFQSMEPGIEADVIEHLSAYKHCILLEQKMTDPIKAHVDQIYNLTDTATPTHYQANPLETMRQSMEVTNNLLKLAVAQNARVLHASMSNIYSEFQQLDSSHQLDPIHPLICQKEAQRSSEALCSDYRRLHNLDIRVMRITNAFGPHLPLDKGLLLPDIIVKALMNQPINLCNNAGKPCSFSYVDDLVSALQRTLNSSLPSEWVKCGKTFELSISELAHKVVELTQSSSPINFAVHHNNTTSRERALNIQRSWPQKMQLEQGLMKTIDYVEQQLHSNTLLENAISFAHTKRYPFAVHGGY